MPRLVLLLALLELLELLQEDVVFGFEAELSTGYSSSSTVSACPVYIQIISISIKTLSFPVPVSPVAPLPHSPHSLELLPWPPVWVLPAPLASRACLGRASCTMTMPQVMLWEQDAVPIGLWVDSAWVFTLRSHHPRPRVLCA